MILLCFIGRSKENRGRGVDYIYHNHTINFHDGENCKSLLVRHVDDNIVEENETYSLNVKPLNPPNRVIIGDNKNTTITIVDDDSKSIPSYAVSLITITCLVHLLQPINILRCYALILYMSF